MFASEKHVKTSRAEFVQVYSMQTVRDDPADISLERYTCEFTRLFQKETCFSKKTSLRRKQAPRVDAMIHVWL